MTIRSDAYETGYAPKNQSHWTIEAGEAGDYLDEIGSRLTTEESLHPEGEVIITLLALAEAFSF